MTAGQAMSAPIRARTRPRTTGDNTHPATPSPHFPHEGAPSRSYERVKCHMKRVLLSLMMFSVGITASHGDGIVENKENFIGCWTQNFKPRNQAVANGDNTVSVGEGRRILCLSSDMTVWGSFREDGVVTDIDAPSWRIRGKRAELTHGSDQFSETCLLTRKDKDLAVSRCALGGVYSFSCMPREGVATCVE